MRRRAIGLATLVLAGVCGGQPPKSAVTLETLPIFTGKVVLLAAPPGKADAKPEDRGVALVAGDGATYPLIEDDVSRLLFLDRQLQNRPVQLTAQLVPGTKSLRVVCVQTVKDGTVHAVDYWCEQCQISLMEPGTCYCCGDDTVFRERPVPEGLGAGVPQAKAPATGPLADGDFPIAPPYANAPELTVKDGVPKGALHEFTMSSQDSKIYPGLRGPYTRRAAVYVPSQYVAGTPAPFIVVQDGTSATYMGNLPKVLDNMIHERRLPVMAAVFLASGGDDGKGSERGLEYDTVSDKYAVFVETEVLPRIEKDYKVTFTKDPEGRATMGGSSGAAAAFTMAWFRPDLYRRVLSYSGTFVDQQSPMNPASPHGAWEYHENLIPKSDAKPLRIWLQVGERDNGATRDEASLHNWVMANQRMAAVLKAKGYHYRYVFSVGAGHVDRRVVSQTLPDALLWLWQGYPVK